MREAQHTRLHRWVKGMQRGSAMRRLRSSQTDPRRAAGALTCYVKTSFLTWEAACKCSIHRLTSYYAKMLLNKTNSYRS